MPSSIKAGATWPEPGWLLLRLALGFSLAVAAAWLFGRPLVEFLLPVVRPSIGWLDERFGVVFLGLDSTVQDTVVKLRVNLLRMVVIGSHVVEPHPKGWLEVTTALGTVLQPLTIALGLVLAWPGKLGQVAMRLLLVTGVGMLFLVLDLSLTLHAYVWDMLVAGYEPDRFSPLLIFHRLMLGGGRLAMGVLLALLVISLGCRRPA